MDLPLVYRTPDVWIDSALEDPLSLLNDHAHLERKAATNALELLGRWPHGTTPGYWTRQLSSIAKEESDHLYLVVREIEKRKGDLSRYHKNRYAGFLHKRIRSGEGKKELLDRLIVAGLIEARSCERFSLLAKNEQYPDLAKFYESLMASEAGHFRVFFELAQRLWQFYGDIGFDDEVNRWVLIESDAIQAQECGSFMHSSV